MHTEAEHGKKEHICCDQRVYELYNEKNVCFTLPPKRPLGLIIRYVAYDIIIEPSITVMMNRNMIYDVGRFYLALLYVYYFYTWT